MIFNFRSLFFLSIVLFVPLFISFNSNAQELVTNGGFESGNLSGWTQQGMTGQGAWFTYTGNQFDLMPPPEGDFSSATDQSGPDSNILYQDIDLPEGATITCSAIIYYINNTMEPPGDPTELITGGFTKNSSPEVSSRVFVNGDGLNIDKDQPNQQYRVDVMDPSAPAFDTGAGVLMNIFQTQPGDPDVLGYTPINFDLTPYAGSTVRIRAAVAVTIGSLNGSVDAVSCINGKCCRSPNTFPDGA